ncbi:class I SAM-dependent methyltransferase [Pseudomonas sp. RIT-PI-AD]|uniref:class I SAM-dependent methyltransferase n=1 Tax=Pseudomonas sp. RIT-PI-AD TaxID=3035294 RepID=UPI0021D8A804|nr:class I SAM-dependent methyltransferase [Pseudomonas sp. RIT-PI-AD]
MSQDAEVDALLERLQRLLGEQPVPAFRAYPSRLRAHQPDTAERADSCLPPLTPALGELSPRVPPERPPALVAHSLAELLSLEGRQLVESAYLTLLGRPADPEGCAYYLGRLLDGSCSKRDLVFALRHSAEGQAANQELSGLRQAERAMALYRTPVLGPLLRWGAILLRLPRLLTAISHLERRLLRAEVECQQHLEALGRHHLGNEEALRHALLQVQAQIQPQAQQALDHALGAQARLQQDFEALGAREALRDERIAWLKDALDYLHEQRINPMDRHWKALQAQLDEASRSGAPMPNPLAEQRARALDDLRLEVQTQGHLLARKAERRDLEPLQTQLQPLHRDRERQALRQEEDERLLDRFYLELENQFRGTRADIKGRLVHYLDEVRQAVERCQGAPALDIGCGRGEFVELMREHGIDAHGLDLNRRMVEECTRLGLPARQDEALAYLQSLAEDSLSVIAGMQIIEHIEFTHLLRLFKECVRVLRPGGIAIFETPNPRNLLVATHDFYIDPTHLHPIPPVLGQFMLQHCGFGEVRVTELNAFFSHQRIDAGELGERFNQHFYGALDYAVIGRKTAP